MLEHQVIKGNVMRESEHSKDIDQLMNLYIRCTNRITLARYVLFLLIFHFKN